MGEGNLQDNYKGVFDGRIGFGRRPAVLVVDFVNAYTTEGKPLYAAPVVHAVNETIELLETARRNDVPVIYTRVIYSPSGADGGIFVKKVPVLRSMVEGEPLTEIVPTSSSRNNTQVHSSAHHWLPC